MITLDELIRDGELLVDDDLKLDEQKYIDWVYCINKYYTKSDDQINVNLLNQNFKSAISQFIKDDDSDGKYKRHMKYHYFNLLACLKSMLNNED